MLNDENLSVIEMMKEIAKLGSEYEQLLDKRMKNHISEKDFDILAKQNNDRRDFLNQKLKTVMDAAIKKH